LRLRTRFAPSPTGLLHVGNAVSALRCQQWAEAHNAELLLRIEDIDHTRCRPAYDDALIEDLRWLGLRWPLPVRRQSEHLADYQQAIEQLRKQDLIYPCFCTRRRIADEIARIASAPHADDAPHRYPGICRKLDRAEQQRRMRWKPFAWRLDAKRARVLVGDDLTWRDISGHRYRAAVDEDVVIARKDILVSYHLAVVVDDALQGVTHVIRGADLRDSTPLHRLLQALLELPEPAYLHHPLLLDCDGRRLAKRNRATTLQSLRQAGVQPKALREWLLREPLPRWPVPDATARTLPEPISRMLGKTP